MSHHRYAITTNEGLNEERLPITARLSPIGSASSDTEYDRRSLFRFYFFSPKIIFQFFFFSVNENRALIEEREKLSASLAALTHHVAHVQFRLQQVISAPTPEDREVGQYKMIH
jgi:hypothetical protein